MASYFFLEIPEDCPDEPCENGGECVDNGVDSLHCECSFGFSGDYCGTFINAMIVKNQDNMNLYI